jgi:hypothetical protein
MKSESSVATVLGRIKHGKDEEKCCMAQVSLRILSLEETHIFVGMNMFLGISVHTEVK